MCFVFLKIGIQISELLLVESRGAISPERIRINSPTISTHLSDFISNSAKKKKESGII